MIQQKQGQSGTLSPSSSNHKDFDKNQWQHPYVDVFKHCKLMPVADWKVNKRHGEVSEYFAKEIGRKVMVLGGAISANNYIQIPCPTSGIKNLGLIGRYLYLQVKAPQNSTPMSFHFDLQMAGRAQSIIRISASNLYKVFDTQNQNTLQVPLSLDINRWTVVVFDIVDLLKRSGLLETTYSIPESYTIRSITLCGNSHVRGVYTSDQEHDHVTFPPEMRFKLPQHFKIENWPDYFAWLELPADMMDKELPRTMGQKEQADERKEQVKARTAHTREGRDKYMSGEERKAMEQEIFDFQEKEMGLNHTSMRSKVASRERMGAEIDSQTAGTQGPNSGSRYVEEQRIVSGVRSQQMSDYGSVQGYQGHNYGRAKITRSDKLAYHDPIMELTHIIGYFPERCATLKWSRIPREKIMLFTSSGTIIAMDVESKVQKRFYFGHTAPICCFDVSPDGLMVASAQDGTTTKHVCPKDRCKDFEYCSRECQKIHQKLSTVRIWNYQTARCMATLPMNCEKIVCVSWSPDSKQLAVVTESKTTNFSGITVAKETNEKDFLFESRPVTILLDKENQLINKTKEEIFKDKLESFKEDVLGSKDENGRRGQEKTGAKIEQASKKQSIVVYYIHNAPNYVPPIIAKQTSDVDIKCLKFSPFNNEEGGSILVSSGFENIRFWEIRDARDQQQQFVTVGEAFAMKRREKGLNPKATYTCLSGEGTAKDLNRQGIQPVNIRGTPVRILDPMQADAKKLRKHFSKNKSTNFRGEDFLCLDFKNAQRHVTDNWPYQVDQRKQYVYVGSMSGKVFLIDYSSKTLDQTFNKMDSAVLSIAVNEQFCVTGSADNHVRVWNPDLQDAIVTSEHKKAISSVDISADGLQVICGCLTGTIGLLDRGEYKEVPLTRCHTDDILCMEYHQGQDSIITVSKDRTIRVFRCDNFEQKDEFYCKPDKISQPLCVAGHPTMNRFAVGFEEGETRICDVASHSELYRFQQFKEAVVKVAYSPSGDLLVTACRNGSIALHNAARDHLPIKIMALEFPPEYIHIDFSNPITRLRHVAEAGRVLHDEQMDSEGGSQFAPHSYEKQSTRQSGFGRGSQSYGDRIQSMDASEEEMDVGSQMDQTEGQDYEVIDDNGNNERYRRVRDSMFGILGDHGNNLMIYETDSIVLRHKICVGAVIRSFKFHPDAKKVTVITKDLRTRVYELSKFEGQYLSELASVHREGISAFDMSSNGQYMLTAGDDKLIKLWDSNASKNDPQYFQAFIGHTFPVEKCFFKPGDNSIIYSTGPKDGIYVWEFKGDVGPYHLEREEDEGPYEKNSNDYNKPSKLEEMRGMVKELRLPKLQKGSFKVEPFTQLKAFDERNVMNASFAHQKNTFETLDENLPKHFYNKRREEMQLPYNHFISMRDVKDYEGPQSQVQHEEIALDGQMKKTTLDSAKIVIAEPKNIQGYDAFSGVHDNLYWEPCKGHLVYTLHNKLIFEDTKDRDQFICDDSMNRLSCLACSDVERDDVRQLCAVGQGDIYNEQSAKILVYEICKKPLKGNKKAPVEKPKLMFTLDGGQHQQGIQSLCFAKVDKKLISIEQGEHPKFVVWDLTLEGGSNSIACGQLEHQSPLNHVCADLTPNGELNFVLVGQDGNFAFITLPNPDEQMGQQDHGHNHHAKSNCHVEISYPQNAEEYGDSNFCTAVFVPLNVSRQLLVLIGDDKGNVILFDPSTGRFEEKECPQHSDDIGAIGCISFPTCPVSENDRKSGKGGCQFVVLGTASGNVFQYQVTNKALGMSRFLPGQQENTDKPIQLGGGPVVALGMDTINGEGLVGTADGTISYIKFMGEELSESGIPLVRKMTPCMERVGHIIHVPDQQSGSNEMVVIGSTGEGQGELKLYTANALDQIHTFDSKKEDKSFGPVACILLTNSEFHRNNKEKRDKKQMAEFVQMVVYRNGFIRLLNIKNLTEINNGKGSRYNLCDNSHKQQQSQMTMDSAKDKDKYETSLCLEPGEEITCGSFSPQCQFNFVLGTSYGNIYIGHYAGEGVVEEGWTLQGRTGGKGDSKFQLKVTKISQVTDGDTLLGPQVGPNEKPYAVTSVQMTSFNPTGYIAVAFENGVVRTWQLLYRAEARKKFDILKAQHALNRMKTPFSFDLADLGYLQFDTFDILDMNAPDRAGDREFHEGYNNNQAFLDIRHEFCEAVFVKDRHNNYPEVVGPNKEYISYCSGIPKLFIRKIEDHQLRATIDLSFLQLVPGGKYDQLEQYDAYPTCLRLDNYTDFIKEAQTLEVKKGCKNSQIAMVGSKCGRLHVLHILAEKKKNRDVEEREEEEAPKKNSSLLFRTRGGQIYGEVSAISSKFTGDHLTVASSCGELINFSTKTALGDHHKT